MNYDSISDWDLYIPPTAAVPTPDDLWPYPKTDVPSGNRPMLIVVSNPGSLHAAREAREKYPQLPIVIWAWRLLESLTADAEDICPVVFGFPQHEEVLETMENWAGRTKLTSTLFDCESAFEFTYDFDLPEDYIYKRLTQER